MKSKIKEGVSTNAEHYPCLKIVTKPADKIMVVLFTKKMNGVVVFSERDFQPIGYTSEGWSEESFTVFNGTIELSNN